MTVIGLLLLPTAVFAVNLDDGLKVSGIDTVAGYGTYIQASIVTPNTKVIFDILNPEGELFSLPGVAKNSGVAKIDLPESYTTLSGQYKFNAKREGSDLTSSVGLFTVYPGEVSQFKSMISPEDQVIRSSNEKALMTVKLVDDFNNPIPGHSVKLVSSSNTDFIDLYSQSNLTDENGEIVFSTYREDSGVSTYSVYDVTDDIIIGQKAKVVYFDDNEFVFGQDNFDDFAYKSFGNSSGPIDHLTFENIPSFIKLNETVVFTVTAYDAVNQKVNDYGNTIHFAVTSANASYSQLPDDYAFVPEDLGSHTFSLAMKFSQPGTYVVEARDISNAQVYGQYNFVVHETDIPVGSKITISSPVSGTYSENVILIQGKALPAALLKIYDNNLEIGSITADLIGNFQFSTAPLHDGLHKIYVASVNNIGTIEETSPTIDLSIDTEAPDDFQIFFEPVGPYQPGTLIKVKLSVKDPLASAFAIYQENPFEMTYNTEGLYEVSLSAPMEQGQYKIDFRIKDLLGNESIIEDEAVLTVGEALPGDPIDPVDPVVDQLGEVTGLWAESNDGRVTLHWSPPISGLDRVKNYRIFFGTAPDNLTEAIDTFTEATTWYVPNLTNGTEYYFTVMAIDQAGGTSPFFSNIVASVPRSPVIDVVPPEIANGAMGGEAIDDMESDVSDTGPEVIWLLYLSVLASLFYWYFSKKRKMLEDSFFGVTEIDDFIDR